jgi:hypothetical protein
MRLGIAASAWLPAGAGVNWVDTIRSQVLPTALLFQGT